MTIFRYSSKRNQQVQKDRKETFLLKKVGGWGWRDGSKVKSTSEGSEFKSQQPHGGLQPSVVRSDASSGVSEDSYNVLTYNNK